MIRFWFLLVIAINCANGKSDNYLAFFTKDYFLENNLPFGVVFACWNDYEKLDFFRRMAPYGIRLSYVPISTGIHMESVLKVNYYRLGVVLDFDCPRSETILEQFTNNKLRFNETYFWLLTTESTNIPMQHLRDLPLNIATEMTLAARINNSFTLFDVYNYSHRHGGRLNITHKGSWSPMEGLKNELVQYKYERRGNFHGLALNVSMHLDHPTIPDIYKYLTTPIDRHLDTMVRFNYALIEQLRDTYNFTMNLKRGDTWGYLIDGSFNGILGDMTKGIVDISASPIQYKIERIDVCEYTVPAYIARPCFIFRHPKTHEIRNIFLKPFKETVWYCILVTGFLYWLFLYFTVKVEHYFHPQVPSCTLDNYPSSETALITIAAFTQQGLSDGPRSSSGRIVFLFLFIWGLLLLQFYSASIVGSLLSKPPRYINTLEDLSNSSLEIGIEDIAYNYDFFRLTTDPVAQELYRKKVAVNKKRKVAPFYLPEEGLKKVQKGGFAFHVDVATAYKIIMDTFNEDEICDLVEIQLFPPKPVSTSTAKHSPFKKMVTYGLRKIVERGVPGRLSQIWKHRRPECPESHQSNPIPVAVQEFSTALFLLILGCGVSIFILLTENCVKRHLTHSKVASNRIWTKAVSEIRNRK